jgi:hypothetical protein
MSPPSTFGDNFLQPNEPLVGTNVKRDWLNTHRDIEQSAEFCQPVAPIASILGDKKDVVHLFIDAEEMHKEEMDLLAAEEEDHVPELFLVTLHRRESEASTPLFNF